MPFSDAFKQDIHFLKDIDLDKFSIDIDANENLVHKNKRSCLINYLMRFIRKVTCQTFCKGNIDAVTKHILINAYKDIKDGIRLSAEEKLNVATAIDVLDKFVKKHGRQDKQIQELIERVEKIQILPAVFNLGNNMRQEDQNINNLIKEVQAEEAVKKNNKDPADEKLNKEAKDLFKPENLKTLDIPLPIREDKMAELEKLLRNYSLQVKDREIFAKENEDNFAVADPIEKSKITQLLTQLNALEALLLKNLTKDDRDSLCEFLSNFHESFSKLSPHVIKILVEIGFNSPKQKFLKSLFDVIFKMKIKKNLPPLSKVFLNI